MVRPSKWALAVLALIFSAHLLIAASPTEEDRAFAVAQDELQSFPDVAERNFANFIQKYPYSVRLPEAILDQARARISSGQPGNAIELLRTNQYRAAKLEPDYLYWLGTAQFQVGASAAAAVTFDEVVQKYKESPKALDSSIREAEALARMEQWPHVVQLLEDTNGPFLSAIRSGAKSETIAAGQLLLGDAYLAQGNFEGANMALTALNQLILTTDLVWQKNYLTARLQRAQNRLEDALLSSADLLNSGNPTNRAEGVSFQAGVFEQLGNPEAAVNTYTNNLVPDAPPEQQRRAVLKIAELDLSQNKLPDAALRLVNFLDRNTNLPSTDLAMLTLGEIRLKQALSGSDTNLTGGETNLLEKALIHFDTLPIRFPNSPLVGKALLDKGWTLWSQNRIGESEQAFQAATGRLPFSGEQAEARFKWADAQYRQGDFAGSITNYYYIAENYASVPEVKENNLIERALYQSLRAALNETNLASANTALKNILTWYPNGFAGPSALLLTGQGLAAQKNPSGARELFADFQQRYPTNLLTPDVRLAIARTYEEEGSWEAAITNFSDWIAVFATHSMVPQAKFSLAWDNYMAGHETNAFMLFTNFIAQYPANELSMRAQFWLGDYYFRQKNFLTAEKNYQLVYQNTNSPPSDVTNLMAQARMMAGRSAMERFAYKEAMTYFNSLLSQDYPRELQVEATMAYADAAINQDSTNKTANLNNAISSLQTIVDVESNTPAAALAMGRIADCYFEWGSVDPEKYSYAATNYQRVAEAPYASDAAKDQARFGRGAVLEKQAARKTGDEQTALLKQALAQYVDAFYQGLHETEKPSPLWTKKAGLKAGELAESLQEWQSAYCVYKQLKDLLPVMAATCDKKMEKASSHGATPERCAL